MLQLRSLQSINAQLSILAPDGLHFDKLKEYQMTHNSWILVVCLAIVLFAAAPSAFADDTPQNQDDDFPGWVDFADWGWYAGGGAPATEKCTKQSCRDCLPNIFLGTIDCAQVSYSQACSCSKVWPTGAPQPVCRLKGICTRVSVV